MPGILIKTRFSSTTPTSQPTKKKDGTASHSSALTQLNGKCCRARLPKRPLVRLSSSSSIQSALLIVLSPSLSLTLDPFLRRATLENFCACHVQPVQLWQSPSAVPSSSYSLKATNPAQCTCCRSIPQLRPPSLPSPALAWPGLLLVWLQCERK